MLVVEDNPVNMMVIQGLLKKLGYLSITKALDGQEAVEKATAETYDLILMDCQMPRLDGYDATRRLRELGIATPIVAMTAHTLSGDREKCLEAGMDDYLTKPIALDKLATTLQHWLNPAASDRNEGRVEGDATPASDALSKTDTVFKGDEFLALMDDDLTLAATLVQMFVNNMPGDIEKLRTAVASGEGPQIRAAAHFIKGAAANLFAPGINAIAFEIEQAGIGGQLARAKALMPNLDSSWLAFVKHREVVKYLEIKLD